MKKRNSEAKTEALVVHALPGRVRLRLRDKRQDDTYYEALEGAVRNIPGVNRLELNPRTGSVFIDYDPDTGEDLQQFLAGNDFFAIRCNATASENPGGRAVNGGRGQSGPAPSGLQLAALGLIGWSCYKLMRGGWKSPEWYVTLWYAYNLQREHEARLRGAMAMLG